MVSSVTNHHHLLSKIATNDGHGENSAYFDGWKAYESNPFHLTDNPHGVIQMGLAENQLCFDLIEDWIKRNPEASVCTAEGVTEFRDIAIYQDYHGLPAFRKGVAKLMEKVRGGRVKFDPDRIIMSGGATGAHELMAFCLADPGEAFLVPTPYYPGFDRDLRWRTRVQLLPVICKSSNNFNLTIDALEAAYENAQKDNIKVKGVLITNPSNPLGTVFDRETLKTLVRFINRKNIHLVCDEIYAATIFNNPKFIGISEIIEEMECNRDLIHIVYSLSKDLGLPGFRVGVVYSYNDDVVNIGRKMSSFGLVSTQTQWLIAAMLSDDEFVAKLIAESARKLATRHKIFTRRLEQVGIKCLKSNAGLFCWMDLRWLLREATVKGEIDLWHIIINKIKLNVSPGSSFHCSEPGWFRVCFANMDDNTMEVALRRIRAFVAPKSRRLRISLSGRKMDEVAMALTPHIMSPHCLLSPHSPLIRAKN